MGPARTARILLMLVSPASSLRTPSVLRPAVWDVPEASTLVRYLNGGCPWCVHFIYDEYYMANLLSVLNSSWEKLHKGTFHLVPVHGKETECVPHDKFFMCDNVTRPRIPRNDADLVGETVVFWSLLTPPSLETH